MNTKLFVGNLPFNVTEKDIVDLFSEHGAVSEVSIMLDKASGRSRGFAFVTMETPEAARAAVEALHGKDFHGRALTLNEARSQKGARNVGAGGRGSSREPRQRGDEGDHDTNAR